MTKKQNIAALVLNIIILISSFTGITYNLFKNGGFHPETFLYYTTQSNLLLMGISLVFATFQYKKIKNNDIKISNYLYITKYVITVAITITFLVFMFVLTPEIIARQDYESLLTLSNFTLHYISPILAIISFLMFDWQIQIKNKHAFLSTITPLAYFAFAMLLSLIPGEGFFETDTGFTKFPYFFLNYVTNGWLNLSGGFFGIGVIWWVVIIFGLVVGLGKLYLSLINLRKKQISNK